MPLYDLCLHCGNGTITAYQAPTCTATGRETCSNCGSHTLSALGHDWGVPSTDFGEWETIKVPTCTDTGEKQKVTTTEWTCKRCGEVRVDEVVETEEVAALGHDFVYQSTVLPTTTTRGYDIYKCARCGEIVHRNFVEPQRETAFLAKYNSKWRQVTKVLCKLEGVWQEENNVKAKYKGKWRNGDRSHITLE